MKKIITCLLIVLCFFAYSTPMLANNEQEITTIIDDYFENISKQYHDEIEAHTQNVVDYLNLLSSINWSIKELEITHIIDNIIYTEENIFVRITETRKGIYNVGNNGKTQYSAGDVWHMIALDFDLNIVHDYIFDTTTENIDMYRYFPELFEESNPETIDKIQIYSILLIISIMGLLVTNIIFKTKKS